MKVLIAIVMFVLGLFVGLLSTPLLQEFSTTMYQEEEYSMPRVKTKLRAFGITLPAEASDLNVFLTQNGSENQVWLKFVCPADVKDEFVERLNSSHAGHFKRDLPPPKTYDGTIITWWTFNTTYHYYEFNDMCMAYDELMQTVYLYAYNDGSVEHAKRSD